MTETLQGIVLERVKHSDTVDIVGVYTLTRGRVGLLVPSAGGRSGARRRAALLPLSEVEFQVRWQPSRQLQRPAQLVPLSRFPGLYADPAKMAVGFFLREFLSALLREYPADGRLYDYLREALTALDAANPSETANFHICFLATLAEPLGVAPDTSGAGLPGAYFDMRSAGYAQGVPHHRDVLTGIDARIPVILEGLSLSESSGLRLARGDRRRILSALIRFYAIHFPCLDHLRTPEVLTELFD